MVLFKRKPVEFVPPPRIPEPFDPSQRVWVIPETGEWFLDYEAYLDRMSYYNIKKFVCETSGNSNFTYFEALKVEKTELQLMETKFPDPVKEPILRYVSFSTVPRIDVMVDDVYNRFKDDFFPGDQVIVRGMHERFRGIIREKARFNPITLADGTVRNGYCSYRVLLETNEEITVNDASQLARERNTFTKWFVKSFLKMSLVRANRPGAPWVVRPAIAQKYRIPSEYPAALRKYEAMLDSTDAASAANGANSVSTDFADSSVSADLTDNGSSRWDDSTPLANIFDDMKETPPTGSEQEAGRNLQRWKDRWYRVLKQATAFFEPTDPGVVDPELKRKVEDMFEFAGVERLEHFDPDRVNFFISPRTYSSRVHFEPNDYFSYIRSHRIKVWHYEKCLRFFKSINITPRKIEQARQYAQLPAAEFDDVKRLIIANRNYPRAAIQHTLPVENRRLLAKQPVGVVDLDAEERRHNARRGGNGSGSGRRMKPLLEDDMTLPFKRIPGASSVPHLHKLDSSFGDPSELLEVWVFVNMYGKALVIDNFTFDDFCTALAWKDNEQPCVLLLEVFCALLSAVLDEHGDLQVSLPEELMEGEGETSEEDAKVKKEEVKKEDGKQEDGKSEQEDAEQDDVKDNTDDSDEITHNAYAAIEYRKIPWQERLEHRQFKNGGWIIILLGIFSLVDYTPEYTGAINEIYQILTPAEYAPTPRTLQENFYKKLGPDLRVKALGILTNLLLNGTVIRGFIDSQAEESAKYRRERFELVHQLKTALEEARDAQRQILDILDGVDVEGIEAKLRESGKGDEQMMKMRHGRGRGGRPSHNYLPREPTGLEKEVSKNNPELTRLVKLRVEKQARIAELKVRRKEIERHLTELNIQRVRYVGRDARYNRYWWFERNGLPNLEAIAHDNEDEDEEEDDEDEDDEDEDENDEEEDKKEDGKKEDSEKEEDEKEEDKREDDKKEDDKKEDDKEEDKDNDSSKSVNTTDKYISDTYLMGRLWIQGPTDSDRKYHLMVSDKQMLKLKDNAEKALGLKFDGKVVRDLSGNEVVHEDGTVLDRSFSPIEKKALLERPDLLLESGDWRYLERVEDFEKLLGELNVEGVREKGLKETCLALQGPIRSRLKARVSFLGLDKKNEEQKELEQIETENEVSEKERNEIKEEYIDSWKNEEESDEEKEVKEEGNENKGKKRVAIESDTSRKHRPTPAARIALREKAKRKKDLIDEKDSKCKDAREKLAAIEEARDRENVLLWVNSSALKQMEHTHYDGPKINIKKKTKKRKGRR